MADIYPINTGDVFRNVSVTVSR